jgi:hypothetical protein
MEKEKEEEKRRKLFSKLIPKPTLLIIFFRFEIFITIITFPYILAWLNVVFTYEYLTTSDYPTYSDSLYMGLGTFWFDRYLVDWWVILSDSIYFVVIIQQALSISMLYTMQIPGRTANIFILGSFAVIKILTFIIRAYQIIWCAQFNICRGDPPDPTIANPIFIYMLSMNAAWIIFLIIYGLLWFIGIFETSFDNFSEEFIRNITRYISSEEYLNRKKVLIKKQISF